MNFTSKDVLNAIKHGAKNVILNREELNRINVFPVRDGDTGNNLTTLMRHVLEHPFSLKDYEEDLRSISDAATLGARGNSGVIFAQYLNGFSDHLSIRDELTIQDLMYASDFAAKLAKESVENPVEGTMLTLMREWGNLLGHYDSTHVVSDFLHEALRQLEMHLANTKNQLKVLKEYDVVDAGAKGFHYFIEGFVKYLLGDRMLIEDVIEDIPIQHDVCTHIEFNYCTEFLIRKSKSITDLKDRLSEIGDSIVIANNERIVKVHLHTNVPVESMKIVREYGGFIKQKVDNMSIQNKVIERKRKRAIVTDSIADLPQEFLDEQMIHVISMNVLVGDETYLDRLTIDAKEVVHGLSSKKHPTSSLPSMQQMKDLFSYLKSNYEEVLFIIVSSKLSGTYSALKQMSTHYVSDHFKVHLIDSMQNSGAEGLLVSEASDLLQEDMSFSDISVRLNRLKERTRILVLVDDLDAMVQSGRLTETIGKFGKMVHLKPIVTLKEGFGSLFGVGFSKLMVEKKIYRHLLKQKGIKRLNIVHVCSEKRAYAMADHIKNNLGIDVDYITETSSIVAFGAGRSAIGISYMTEYE